MKTIEEVLEWIENELDRIQEKRDAIDSKFRPKEWADLRDEHACLLVINRFKKLKRFIHEND